MPTHHAKEPLPAWVELVDAAYNKLVVLISLSIIVVTIVYIGFTGNVATGILRGLALFLLFNTGMITARICIKGLYLLTSGTAHSHPTERVATLSLFLVGALLLGFLAGSM